MNRDFLQFQGFVLGLYITLIVCVILFAYACTFGNDLPTCPHFIENMQPSMRHEYNTNRVTRMALASKHPHGCDTIHKPPGIDIGSLKNGDIIMISYEGIRTTFTSAFYDSIWMHPGLVWRDPASHEFYILELAAYNIPYNGSSVRIPLSKWLRINRNSNAFGLLSINKSLDAWEMDKAFEFYERRDIGVESLKKSWTRFLEKKTRAELHPSELYALPEKALRPKHKIRTIGIPLADFADCLPVPEVVKPRASTLFGDTFDYVLTCHEMVIDVLQKCGAMDDTYAPTSFLPNVLPNRTVPMKEGFEYSPLKHISIEEYNIIGRL